MIAWLVAHKWRIGRTAVLLLVLLAVLGPWTYSRDGVPPAKWCKEPFILLDQDYCVKTLSGAWLVAFIFINFPAMLVGAVTGADLTGRAVEYLVAFLALLGTILVLMPLICTLVLLRDPPSRR